MSERAGNERTVVLDEPVVVDETGEALRVATERAERAERELAKLKGAASSAAAPAPAAATSGRADARDAGLKEPMTPSTAAAAGEAEEPAAGEMGGVAELQKDSMMAHLLDSLDAGEDIGHYGRLVFAMVARHFLPHDEVLARLMKDPDFAEEQARVMLQQVEGRDYNPPKRERILEWQREQTFPILPDPDDPDCGNLYRNLKFPEAVYAHIGHYQEKKLDG